MTYDIAGNRTSMTDPDAGTMTYTYDGLGRIKSQKDARNQQVNYTYDSYGRMQSGPVGGTPLVSNSYGTGSSNKGLLLSASVGNTYQAFYTYDGYGRITAKRCQLPTEGSRTFEYTYNTDGLPATKTYPDGTVTAFQYDAYGNHVSTTIGSTVVWQLTQATGSTSKYQLAGTLLMEETCNAMGMLTARTLKHGGSPLHGMTFAYSPSTGNLTQRTGMLPSAETFTYDALERLTQAGSLAMTYSTDGNILSKTDMGQYYYEGAKPHAVTGIDNSRFLVSDAQQTVTYNGMGKATRIQGADGYNVYINFGPEGERWQGAFSHGNEQYTVLYLDDYEETIVSQQVSKSVCYLDGGVLAMRDANGTLSLYVPFTDNLGSVTRIYDSSAHEVFNASYDAWGNQTLWLNDIGFIRGYTGHEMLPQFGLINMNGRLYDPQIGRFLSTDNFVQEPYGSQNFNRYSYCLNNPLKYTDPSGEMFGIDDLISVAVIAYIGGIVANVSHCSNTNSNPFNPVNWNWSSAGTYLGVAGGTLNALGVTLNVPGIITNGVLHAAGNITINGITNISENHDFFENWGLSAITGFGEGAIGGYLEAKRKGLNYWWGNRLKYNRTQWSFINTDKPDYYIELMHTRPITYSKNDCMIATMTEIENEKGGSRTYNYFSDMVSNNRTPDGVIMKVGYYKQLLNDNFNTTELTRQSNLLFDHNYMKEVALRGDVITVHFTNPGHADNVRKLKVFLRDTNKNTLVFRQSMFNANQLKFNYKNGVSFILRIH
jgi:RHS repeat-associated protein